MRKNKRIGIGNDIWNSPLHLLLKEEFSNEIENILCDSLTHFDIIVDEVTTEDHDMDIYRVKILNWDDAAHTHEVTKLFTDYAEIVNYIKENIKNNDNSRPDLHGNTLPKPMGKINPVFFIGVGFAAFLMLSRLIKRGKKYE